MNKSIRLKHPLLVQKPINNLSCPQKCKLSQNIDFPASSLIVVKSESRKFICRLYYLNEIYYDKKLAFIDDSVEINPESCDSSCDEIKWIEEIELIDKSPVEFREIKINLRLNVSDINLDVIKTADDLTKLTMSIVKHYIFCADSVISCNRNGISKVFVTETDSCGFGALSRNGVINISRVSVASQVFIRRKEFGGLKMAEASLEGLIQSSFNYSKNPDSYPFKPSCQALLSGPVGSGKTSLVHNVANKLNCIMFELTGDVFKPLPGETEENIQKAFEKIKAISKIVSNNQVILLLIENIEIFCPKFNPKMKENSHSARISALMLTLLDEIAQSDIPMVVIGTTSKIESVDIAVRRCNRMGCNEIVLQMPDEAHRFKIIKILCNEITKERISEDVMLFVAQSTPGFVGADLELLCQFVSRHLISENLEINEANLHQAFQIGLKSITPSVMRENLGLVTRCTLKLDAIGGMKELKKSLLTSVLGPLQHPEKFHRLGLRSPSGILLYGPSGCAKTTIVKCLAGESKMTLISVSSAEIYSPYVGEAEKFIVKIFNQARMNAPTILFFDEIDTIVGNRSVSGGGNDSHMRILSTLLTEIDGFSGGDKKTVLIMGATNKPHMIDDALIRPGRFDKLIHVPAPDYESRISILKFASQSMPISENVQIATLAKRTKNFSGADLINLCNEAALNAATKDLQSEEITNEDFDDVLAYIGPSLSENQIQFYANFENARRRKN